MCVACLQINVSPSDLQAVCVPLLQLPLTGSGSLVFKIDPLAPAAETLEVNDVVLEIEGVPIADDGTVEFRNEERVEFSHIVRSKHIGGHCQWPYQAN